MHHNLNVMQHRDWIYTKLDSTSYCLYESHCLRQYEKSDRLKHASDENRLSGRLQNWHRSFVKKKLTVNQANMLYGAQWFRPGQEQSWQLTDCKLLFKKLSIILLVCQCKTNTAHIFKQVNWKSDQWVICITQNRLSFTMTVLSL